MLTEEMISRFVHEEVPYFVYMSGSGQLTLQQEISPDRLRRRSIAIILS